MPHISSHIISCYKQSWLLCSVLCCLSSAWDNLRFAKIIITTHAMHHVVKRNKPVALVELFELVLKTTWALFLILICVQCWGISFLRDWKIWHRTYLYKRDQKNATIDTYTCIYLIFYLLHNSSHLVIRSLFVDLSKQSILVSTPNQQI